MFHWIELTPLHSVTSIIHCFIPAGEWRKWIDFVTLRSIAVKSINPFIASLQWMDLIWFHWPFHSFASLNHFALVPFEWIHWVEFIGTHGFIHYVHYIHYTHTVLYIHSLPPFIGFVPFTLITFGSLTLHQFRSVHLVHFTSFINHPISFNSVNWLKWIDSLNSLHSFASLNHSALVCFLVRYTPIHAALTVSAPHSLTLNQCLHLLYISLRFHSFSSLRSFFTHSSNFIRLLRSVYAAIVT